MSSPLVLLVDAGDTPDILGVALEHAGYQVLRAASGPAGLALAVRHRPDLVASTPVLSVTARVLAHELSAARQVADEVLLKPVRPAAVVSAVARLLGVASGGAERGSGRGSRGR
jgi:CheY-like chemotaxis protein